MPRFCASCGAQMDDTANQCPACGKATAQSTGGGAAVAPAPAVGTGSGIDPKLGGLLCYLPVGPVWLIADIFFLVAEPYKSDKFLRFHAFQSLFTGIALAVLGFAIGIVTIPLALIPIIGAIFDVLLWMALLGGGLVLCIVCMIKAYGGKMWRVPIVGNFAAKQAGV